MIGHSCRIDPNSTVLNHVFRLTPTTRLPSANESGVIETSGIEPSNHESFVVAPGRTRKRILFDLTAWPEAELEIRAPRGGKIIGEVVSADDGRPIPHAVVGHHTSDTTFSIMALFNYCDDKGNFKWDGVSFDFPYSLTAIASGFIPLDLENTVVVDAPPRSCFDVSAIPRRELPPSKSTIVSPR